MTRADALRDLLESVEAGTVDERDFMSWSTQYGLALLTMEEAYRGSVDAAIAFVEAVLPHHAVDQFKKWPGHLTRVALFGTHEFRGERWHCYEDGRFEGEADTPARALLIAALKALIAQEDA